MPDNCVIVWCDLRDFTTLCELCTQQENEEFRNDFLDFMNRYYDSLGKALFSSLDAAGLMPTTGGRPIFPTELEKVVGDGLLFLFNVQPGSLRDAINTIVQCVLGLPHGVKSLVELPANGGWLSRLGTVLSAWNNEEPALPLDHLNLSLAVGIDIGQVDTATLIRRAHRPGEQNQVVGFPLSERLSHFINMACRISDLDDQPESSGLIRRFLSLFSELPPNRRGVFITNRVFLHLNQGLAPYFERRIRRIRIKGARRRLSVHFLTREWSSHLVWTRPIIPIHV